ncbi:MAG: serine hydrolase domain-containing protein [Hyphomicrobiales bacterium]
MHQPLSESMPEVDRLMKQAIVDSVFPGAVLLVGRGNRLLMHAAYGTANLFTQQPMTTATVFDLASLTKPLATTLALMRLHQQGRLDVNQRLGTILPAFAASDKSSVTIAQLLSHTSGLPDYRPFYLQLATRPAPERKAMLREWLVKEPLLSPPGERALYSDLDFMILEWVVEAVSDRRLDQFVADEIYAPLGVDSLFFIDLNRPPPAGPYAATEQCGWRGRLMAGEVHDENAHVLGGVAGHAGLFGTAAGVHGVLSELLKAYHQNTGGRLFDRRTVQRFFRRVPGTDKALGFDMPAPVAPSCGLFFPPDSIGHLGFTGTSFWMHLEQSLDVILVTNRVHPTRANIAIRAFRPLIHDVVMGAIGAQPPAAAG